MRDMRDFKHTKRPPKSTFAVIITCSVSSEQRKWMADNQMSPSNILQRAIEELKSGEYSKRELQAQIEHIADRLVCARKLIHEKGLEDEWHARLVKAPVQSGSEGK